MRRQHQRIVDSVGQEIFHEESIRRLPLVLDDSGCYEVAETLGWQRTWVAPKAAPRTAVAKSSAVGDVAVALARAKAGPPPGAVAPPPQPQVPTVRAFGAGSFVSAVGRGVSPGAAAASPTPAQAVAPPPAAPSRVVSPGEPLIQSEALAGLLSYFVFVFLCFCFMFAQVITTD